MQEADTTKPEHVAATSMRPGPDVHAGSLAELSARLDRLEHLLDDVVGYLRNIPQNEAIGPERSAYLGVESRPRAGATGTKEHRPDANGVHHRNQDDSVQPVTGSLAGLERTVRDWFDRRPFVFMTGAFIAAVMVFQIID
jgi:hypothetical protein